MGSLFYFSAIQISMQDSYSQEGFSIKKWAEDDRPREKMQKLGRVALSDAELIAILIGSGVANESAVDLAKRILNSVNNDLNALGQLSISDLKKFKGIGEAKAISIVSALELGRRRRLQTPLKKPKITSSQDAYEVLYPLLADLDHEQFYILLLQRNNTLIDAVKVSQGGVSGTVADTKLIFKAALDKLAVAIIAAHNHPSGNLAPSQADVKLTKNLKEAGKLLDINLLDHLIIAGNQFYSFADEGLI